MGQQLVSNKDRKCFKAALGKKMEKSREKEDPQTYLKARFSIMSLNEISAYKGRADKYGRGMVLCNNRVEGGGLLITLLIIWRR